MTSYFDDKQEQAGRLLDYAMKLDLSPEVHPASDEKWHNDLKILEEQVVFDCSVCVEFPGCPEEIRDRVAKCIYQYAVYCQPVNRAPRFQPNPDTATEHAKSIANLVWDLHTIFHDLSAKGFSDNPESPLRRLAAAGEERREALVPKEEWTDLAKDMAEGKLDL